MTCFGKINYMHDQNERNFLGAWNFYKFLGSFNYNVQVLLLFKSWRQEITSSPAFYKQIRFDRISI